MKNRPGDESARDAQERLEFFLDCVARLLAKRWLCESRAQANESAVEELAHHDNEGPPPSPARSRALNKRRR